MKNYVITLKPTWLYQIMHGGKDVENRLFRPIYKGQSLVGKRVLLHCSVNENWQLVNHFGIDSRLIMPMKGMICASAMVSGAIRVKNGKLERFGIGVNDAIMYEKSEWYRDGYWGWILKDVFEVRKVKAKGRLSVWIYEGDVQGVLL